MSQSSKFTLYRNGNEYISTIENTPAGDYVQSIGDATGEITLDSYLTMIENELGVDTNALSEAIVSDGTPLILNYSIATGEVTAEVASAIARHRPISYVQDTGTVTYYYAGSVGAQIAYVAHVWDTFGMGHKMFLYRNDSIESIITYDYETPII